eukprot:CAMPEP_0179280368 /NCGR_PEP_ID=MMETSP0797-20121207/36593_1 /TAXON_ID=47934 /ORGANISM="Dinophysis acuminata, Strain DAEP01" /LENGTH=57 /DNA_ID=CAMNT_0020989025 /DNA_START=57 /DNA_END=226 /DNA_ORIENTATION=+
MRACRRSKLEGTAPSGGAARSLRVEQEAGDERDNDGEELDHADTDERVGEEVLLHRR